MDSSHSANFATLFKTLRQLIYQLENKRDSRIMVGRGTLQEFKRQKLAAHNIITPRKLMGPRVPTRDRKRGDHIRLVSARWPKDHMHEATMPAFFIFLGGKADMRIADYSVQCLPGDAILIPAGLPRSDGTVPEYVDITPDSSCDLLRFSPGLVISRGLECSIAHSRGKKYIAGAEDERCWVQHLLLANIFTGLCEELEGRGNSSTSHYLLLLVLTLFSQCIEEGKGRKGWVFTPLSMPRVKGVLMQKAVEYINDHLGEPLTINMVARHIAVSRAVFTHEFRRETGYSFKEYVTTQRLNQIKVLLEETSIPVNAISREVGLSTRRLNSLFHQRFQCSPGEYRNSKKLKSK